MAFNRYKSDSVGTTEATVLTSTGTKTVIGLLLANTYAGEITVTVKLGTTHIVKGAVIPQGTSLELIEGKIVMVNTDTIKVTSSIASSCDVIVSVLE